MQFSDSILKAYKQKGLYFIVCLCSITLSNLLECWLFENDNLVLFGFQGYWEQDDKAWQHFLRKIFDKIGVERLTFCKSGSFLYLKWGKLLAKAGQNRRVTALSKPLVH